MLNIYEPVLEKIGELDYDGITDPSDFTELYEILKTYGLNRKAEEQIVLLTFDGLMTLTGIFEVAKGSVQSCEVSLRDLFKRAILANAATIVVAHNHISTDVCPSENDILLTKNMMEASDLLGIFLFDHIITGLEGNWTSMRKMGYFEDIENGKFDSII